MSALPLVEPEVAAPPAPPSESRGRGAAGEVLRICPNGNARRPSCKRRDCPVCGPRWAGDQRRVMEENLRHYGRKVVMVAITPPGADRLPWDESHCRHPNGGRHSGPRGCRVEQRAARAWCDTYTDRLSALRRAGNAHVRRRLCQCGHLKRAHGAGGCSCRGCACSGFTGFVPNLLERVNEPQKRGVPHWHGVFGYSTLAERRAVHMWVAWLRREERCSCGHTKRWHDRGGRAVRGASCITPQKRLSPTLGWTNLRQYDFGFVDGHLKPIEPLEAARYLASYLTGRSAHKASIRQNIVDPTMTYWAVRDAAARAGDGTDDEPVRPRRYSLPLVWVSPRLSSLKRGGTGVTMRTLRRTRQLWNVLTGRYLDDRGNTEPQWFHEVRDSLQTALVFRRTRKRGKRDSESELAAIARFVDDLIKRYEAMPSGYDKMMLRRQALEFVRPIADLRPDLRVVHGGAETLAAAA